MAKFCVSNLSAKQYAQLTAATQIAFSVGQVIFASLVYIPAAIVANNIPQILKEDFADLKTTQLVVVNSVISTALLLTAVSGMTLGIYLLLEIQKGSWKWLLKWIICTCAIELCITVLFIHEVVTQERRFSIIVTYASGMMINVMLITAVRIFRHTQIEEEKVERAKFEAEPQGFVGSG